MSKFNRVKNLSEEGTKISHSEVDGAVKKFLKKGGKITKIDSIDNFVPVNPYATDMYQVFPDVFGVEEL